MSPRELRTKELGRKLGRDRSEIWQWMFNKRIWLTIGTLALAAYLSENIAKIAER